MNPQDFNLLVDSIYKASSKVLQTKAAEYSSDYDRLGNFKTAAALQKCTPEKALAGMMAKHIVSIYDMIDYNYAGPLEIWDEKILDAINYLILLRALIAERRSK